MSKPEKIDVELSDGAAVIVREALTSGEFANADAVVEDALLAWAELRSIGPSDLERLRSQWDQGKASGEPRTLDFDTLRTEAREKLREVRGQVR